MELESLFENFTNHDARLISDLVASYSNCTLKELIIKLHLIYGKEITPSHTFYLGYVVGEKSRPAIAKGELNLTNYLSCKERLN